MDGAETTETSTSTVKEYRTWPLSAAAGLFLTAMILLGGTLAFGGLPRTINATPLDSWYVWRMSVLAVALLGVAAAIMGWAGANKIDVPVRLSEAERSTRLYGAHLVGVGYVLVIGAILVSLMFSSIAWSVSQKPLDTGATQELQKVFTDSTGFDGLFGSTLNEAVFIFAMFVWSTLLAVLGSLMFFANSLWAKVKDPSRPPFDARLFWAGLWFRIGEALVFNLVFFLVFRYNMPSQYLLLPLVSLLVGIFLKSGETLVSGIAERIFAALKALVPTNLDARKAIKLASVSIAEEASLSIEERAKRLAATVSALQKAAGVVQARADATAGTLNVEYDASVIAVGDITRQIAFQGLRNGRVELD
jgi:hypothetical protein